jgi:hypothetical protein
VDSASAQQFSSSKGTPRGPRSDFLREQRLAVYSTYLSKVEKLEDAEDDVSRSFSPLSGPVAQDPDYISANEALGMLVASWNLINPSSRYFAPNPCARRQPVWKPTIIRAIVRSGRVSQTGTTAPTVAVQIEELARLHNLGLVSREEFEWKRAELLRRL